MERLPASLERWHEYPQFILVEGKVPVNVSRQNIDHLNPVNWMPATEACALSEMLGLGVGFVFTDSDPFFFIDVDKCVEDGQWNDVANTIIGMFPGAAIEVSTSGTGLHVFGFAQNLPPHSNKNADFKTELYTEGRYALLTGNELQEGDVWLDWTATVVPFAEQWFPPSETEVADWRFEPVPEWSGPDDDAVLISKILNQQHRFGNRASPADLWNADEAKLSAAYPPLNDTDPYDRSSADAALAAHLAFWTGKNHDRMWRLMCQSKLLREKWNKHKNYLAMTITNAVNQCQNVYNSQRTQTGADSTQNGNDSSLEMNDSEDAQYTTGHQFMSLTQQADHFKGCFYVKHAHKVLTPNGTMLSPERFNAAYGGYTFATTSDNARDTRKAFEAFTENQGVRFPKVDRTCFDPLSPNSRVIEREGLTLVNKYVPLNIKRLPGDISLFMTHMEKLFPNQHDREVMLAYMAAIVQYQGVKFQWCPVIQGTEGNGKTLINRVIQEAVGKRYCHYPNAADLAGGGLKFNGWLEDSIFVAIEEMYTGSGRFDLMDAMKPVITNDQIEIQRKGQDQYTGPICCNIIMNTNHKDAIKITYDQRRYWMNYTPQQSYADLMRDGMDDKYFKRLYDWLKKEDGYAMVTDWLWSYQIPDKLNPATECQRAPNSTSMAEAVYATLGPVEQHILEAIQEERQGFRGGYISSLKLNDLLREIGQHKLGPRVRGEMVKDIGYVRHPALPDGRLNANIMAEGGKPVLYVKGDINMEMQRWEIKDDYELKQGYVNPGGST